MINIGREQFIQNFKNIPGWRTRRKIIVFESDDWGSLRMPSLAAGERLRKAGLDIDSGDQMRYNNNDTLESAEDLACLFEVLTSAGRGFLSGPVFTAVSLVANPDFRKIQENDFRLYYYEPLNVTAERYHGTMKSFDMYQEGIRGRFFVPQFHGREHLNVPVWMNALRNRDEKTLIAFNEQFWGFKPHHRFNIRYQAAFDLENESQLEEQKMILTEGLRLFEMLFGYKAGYFVPPNGPLHNSLEQAAAREGIEGISTAKVFKMPQGNGRHRTFLRHLGQINISGQVYVTRNCFFEPGIKGKDWVSSCLQEINTAFRWGKPAVISTHRVNYIGTLNASNRDNGLKQLGDLLKMIDIRWPAREYMTSSDLVKEIKGSRSGERRQ